MRMRAWSGENAVVRAALFAALAAAAALPAAGCGPEDLQLPASPALDALVAAYDHPTGTIDPQHLDQVTADARARLDQLNLDWLPDLLGAAVVRLGARLDQQGLPTNPAAAPDTGRPIVDAVLHLTQICSGWDDPPGPPDAAKNGTLVVTAVVDGSQLRRTLQVAATACQALLRPTNAIVRSQVATIQASLDGAFGLYFYDRIPRTLTETKVLVGFMGTLGVAGRTASASFDFRLFYPSVDVRLTQPDGDVILTIGPDGATLRGANATYRCDVALQSCGTG
jgi:hypothetical protein